MFSGKKNALEEDTPRSQADACVVDLFILYARGYLARRNKRDSAMRGQGHGGVTRIPPRHQLPNIDQQPTTLTNEDKR